MYINFIYIFLWIIFCYVLFRGFKLKFYINFIFKKLLLFYIRFMFIMIRIYVIYVIIMYRLLSLEIIYFVILL